ncbi:MAG: heparinase [Actinomycetales bacterium]|nr:MAG: heparinase [Actinomycetales bacterium]
MSGREVGVRLRDVARHVTWRRRQVAVGAPATIPADTLERRAFDAPLPPGLRETVPAEVCSRVCEVADGILAGHWDVFGLRRQDIADPDWFFDPVTGRRAPQHAYAFDIDHRDESITGNVKSVWEVSRHHHLTVLAAAYWLTEDPRYAEVCAAQLRSWWAANPFLSGVNWTSGIELGIRLLSWVWIRRLLHHWPGSKELFEGNPAALEQIWWHQEYLTAFPSEGSSGNNHAIAEQVGRLAAACAFPWFAASLTWRTDSGDRLRRHLARNTFADGLNRELASDYHGFVLELVLCAAAEADAVGHSLPVPLWRMLGAGVDAAAALIDVTGRAPRQGDGDDGRALILDGHTGDSWSVSLDIGARVLGTSPWWPATVPSLTSIAVSALADDHRGAQAPRPDRRPSSFADGGVHILRGRTVEGAETWCRCDSGPHGFGSMAAHGHADALAIEFRVDGVDLLADPGTYCYHGEPKWRSYFRTTRAHNTLEVAGQPQSLEGGPFMWQSSAETTLDALRYADEELVGWSAHHDGYRRLPSPVTHYRSVDVDPRTGAVAIIDMLAGAASQEVALRYHLGDQVTCHLEGARAVLTWAGRVTSSAVLELPVELAWSSHRGEEDPPMGWYSPAFGEKLPSTTIEGVGRLAPGVRLETRIRFGSLLG